MRSVSSMHSPPPNSFLAGVNHGLLLGLLGIAVAGLAGGAALVAGSMAMFNDIAPEYKQTRNEGLLQGAGMLAFFSTMLIFLRWTASIRPHASNHTRAALKRWRSAIVAAAALGTAIGMATLSRMALQQDQVGRQGGIEWGWWSSLYLELTGATLVIGVVALLGQFGGFAILGPAP